MFYSQSDFIESVQYSQHQHHTDKPAECYNAVITIAPPLMMLELHRSNIDQLFHMYVLSTTVQAGFEVHPTFYSILWSYLVIVLCLCFLVSFLNMCVCP